MNTDPRGTRKRAEIASFLPAPMDNLDSVILALNRHQRRRAQAIPTLSVLAGAPGAAAAVWQAWVGSVGWPPSVVRPCGGQPDAPWEDVPVDAPGCAVLYRFDPADGGLAATVARLARWLDALGPAQARTALALTLPCADADAYLRAEPYTRAQALFAEGLVELPSASPPPPTDPPPSKGGEEADDDEEDRARSAAERFLFDLLDAHPDTAGLFGLNVRLGFCFGPMSAEVDLLAASLALALEIDGFHHFRDPEGYRRDRRKDALLQTQGYLVLRFLADDVVTRTEEIVEEIRAAVAFRRATR